MPWARDSRLMTLVSQVPRLLPLPLAPLPDPIARLRRTGFRAPVCSPLHTSGSVSEREQLLYTIPDGTASVLFLETCPSHHSVFFPLACLNWSENQKPTHKSMGGCVPSL